MKLQDIYESKLVLSLEDISKDVELVKQIQIRLRDSGFLSLSGVDGILGERTKEALEAFCKKVYLNSFANNTYGKTFAEKLIEYVPAQLITEQQLKAILPYAAENNIKKHLPAINRVLVRYQINTPLLIAHFIAQIGHESGDLNYVEEIASGDAYEGRRDLGNINPGDGRKYKGRGLIQITGRANYTEISKDLGIDFVSNPQLLASNQCAAESAGWYWNKKSLNYWASKDDLISITRIINGGTNGLIDRQIKLTKAKEVLGV